MSEIDTKLGYIREKVDGGNYGRLYGAKETADEVLKIVYAQVFDELRDSAGKLSVAALDAKVRKDQRYIDAVQDKANKYADWKTAETYVRILFAEVDVWRSEEATNRGLDKRSSR